MNRLPVTSKPNKEIHANDVNVHIKTYHANLNTISNNAKHKCGKCFFFYQII